MSFAYLVLSVLLFSLKIELCVFKRDNPDFGVNWDAEPITLNDIVRSANPKAIAF